MRAPRLPPAAGAPATAASRRCAAICLPAMSADTASTAQLPTRFHGMDGFRALAALAIVAFHGYLATSWATSGSPDGAAFVERMPPLVDGAFRNLTLRTNVFFVLSGLLLALPFARWLLLADARRPSLRRFARRRVQRIWPLYLLLMPLAAATVSINRTSVEQVVVNAFLVQNLVPGGTYLLPVTWTLTVELGFYLLMPLVALLAGPWVRRLPTLPLRVAAVATLPLAAIAVACLARRSPDTILGHVRPNTTVLGYLDSFAAGVLAAIVLVAALVGEGRLAAAVRRASPLAWTSAGSLLVATGLAARWHGTTGAAAADPGAAWWWMAPVGTGVACWMLAVALRPDRSALARIVSAPVVLEVGRLSYGIFLWHYIVLHWFSVAGVTRAGGLGAVAANVALVLLVTVPLAWLTWHLVEEPVLDGRVRLPRPALPSWPPRLGAARAAPLPAIAPFAPTMPSATATHPPEQLPAAAPAGAPA